MKLNRRLIIRIPKRVCLLMLSLIVFMAFYSEADAQEILPEQKKDLVIVLDCSQSMQNADSRFDAAEFISELTASLPDNYRMGVVAYQEETVLCLPIGSSYDEIREAVSGLSYMRYGNAGVGLKEALGLFGDKQTEKRVIMISDGEIMMKTEEQTDESSDLFTQSVANAKADGVTIDVLALGEQIEEGESVYPAADATGGTLYELENGESLKAFAGEYLFDGLKVPACPIGKMDGSYGELQIELPDCLMKQAEIILTGTQQNENLTVNCEADGLEVLKGNHYTVIKLAHPSSQKIGIQMRSEKPMDVDAYLTAEYDFLSEISHTYDSDTQQVKLCIGLKNAESRDLLAGHLMDGGIAIWVNGEEGQYEIADNQIVLWRQITEDEMLELQIDFRDNFGIYFGNSVMTEEIILPDIKEKPPIDWFFWCVILFFVAALLLLILLSNKKKKKTPARVKVIDESRMLMAERNSGGNDFYGKIQVYVIHNKEDIDFPPESINLFARCNRDVITLEWILDTCNIPLSLKGAEKIIIKPGDDRSIVIKNNGRATLMKGRELLAKGRAYHLYYHEKVTFIFDQEDAEIEVHYKDLKPNER